MKNKKGMVLPLVMVMMVLSHLMYISLLAYNQIQTQSYHQLIRYYEAKVELDLLVTKLKAYSPKPFVEKEIKDLMLSQGEDLLRDFIVENKLLEGDQVQVLQIWHEGERYLATLSHAVYLNQNQNDWDKYVESIEIDGIVEESKLPQERGNLPIKTWRKAIQGEVGLAGFKEQRSLKRDGQETIELPLGLETDLSFMSGNYFVLGERGDRHDFQIWDPDGSLVTRKAYSKQVVHFFIESQLTIYQEPNEAE